MNDFYGTVCLIGILLLILAFSCLFFSTLIHSDALFPHLTFPIELEAPTTTMSVI